MDFSADGIRRLLRSPEGSDKEFKWVKFKGNEPQEPRRQLLGDEMAAFANSDGGILLCGVTDEAEVRGMTRRQAVLLERTLVELASSSIRPPLQIRTYCTEMAPGTFVVAVQIPAGYAHHASPGGHFYRVGSSKRRMTQDEALRLAQRRGQSRFLWFDKQAVPGTGWRSLSKSLWQPILSVEGQNDPELALEKMGLLSPRAGGPRQSTVAGVLLCCRHPEEFLPNACINATRYRGSDQTSGQIDAQTIGGPIPRQIADAIGFVLRNMRVAARKQPERVDLPQYSERAVFEAVVNAVVHRDYSIQGSTIRISMFDDRLEIRSPGGLPNSLALESMAERQSTRNEVLASALGRMPVGRAKGSGERLYLMERRGDGVPVINRETKSISGRSPQFRILDESELCVTLPAAVVETNAIRATVLVSLHGRRLEGAQVLALFPNNTWKHATSDWRGEARIELHSDHLPMTVLAAGTGLRAAVVEGWVPKEGSLSIDLAPLADGGSIIIRESDGELPGLLGSVRPIRDRLDRTYLYASNIAINCGLQQPVPFSFNDEIRLTDSDGRELFVRIANVTGRCSVLEYRPATGHSDRDVYPR